TTAGGQPPALARPPGGRHRPRRPRGVPLGVHTRLRRAGPPDGQGVPGGGRTRVPPPRPPAAPPPPPLPPPPPRARLPPPPAPLRAGVEVLLLLDQPLGGAALRRLASSPSLSQVRGLFLGGSRLDKGGLRALLTSERLAGLRTLNLCFTAFDDEDARSLGNDS